MDEDADEDINRVDVRRSRLVEDTFQNTLVEYTVFDSVNSILDIGECPDAEVTGCLKQLRKCHRTLTRCCTYQIHLSCIHINIVPLPLCVYLYNIHACMYNYNQPRSRSAKMTKICNHSF